MTDLVTKTRQYLAERRRSYCAMFESDEGRTVLADLADFCRANETTFHHDPRASAVLEGRREVWLRIQEHLQLTEAELWELKRSKKNPSVEG